MNEAHDSHLSNGPRPSLCSDCKNIKVRMAMRKGKKGRKKQCILDERPSFADERAAAGVGHHPNVILDQQVENLLGSYVNTRIF